MAEQHSDALVFFGATGDLAYKQIFPALHAMIKRGRLNSPIVAVAKSGWNLDQLVARAKDSITQHGGLDADTFVKMCSLLQYIDGDYGDIETFKKLRQALGSAKSPLHYLAIPPTMFESVAEKLAESGCNQGARIVVEKPFGHDLKSAQGLNQVLRKFFPEEAIFRIDHYLGKEPVENLVYFRFANPLVASSWGNKHIEHVQITMAENFGVAGRGKFYEEAGAIRDVVQNHMLQVVVNLAMERPKNGDAESLRDVRVALLRSMRPLEAKDIMKAQFRGYKQEPGVAADSVVETYAAMRFAINNDRWQGVPFFVRVGKSLPVTVTEVVVKFKTPHDHMLGDQGVVSPNYYRFRLTPETVIALGTNIKKTGEKMEGEVIELVAHHVSANEMRPYERLLGDALHGDPSLFAREDFVEEAWRIVDPILGAVTPVLEYDQNSWGPEEAKTTLVPEGGWYNPSNEALNPKEYNPQAE